MKRSCISEELFFFYTQYSDMVTSTHLDETSTEKRLVQDHGVGDRGSVSKLDICIALGLASPLVAQNSDTVDGAT